MDPKDKLIIALDVDTQDKAMRLVDTLKNDVRLFKVGLELFSSCGPSIVEDAAKKGCKVFLDLKFHDIPNTVSRAAVSVAGLGAFMFNVHALGGFEMMRKAAEAVKEESLRLKIVAPKIIAVTILTSMDQAELDKTGISGDAAGAVLRLAKLAKDAGLDGVVASPSEIKILRESLGKDFIIVTPGVRPEWAAAQDQKRVATPGRAISDGASFIVVGRPVTEAKNQREAAQKILKEMGS